MTLRDLDALDELRRLADSDTAMAIALLSALDDHAEELIALARRGLSLSVVAPPTPGATTSTTDDVEGTPC